MSEPGTRVTCEDLLTGETDSVVIRDDYVVVCDGACHVDHTAVYSTGTHQLTIKGRVSHEAEPVPR